MKRSILWLLVVFAVLPIGGCLWLAVAIYDETHVATHHMQYPGFEVNLTEEGEFDSISLADKPDAGSALPFKLRLSKDSLSYEVYALTEKEVARYDSRPTVRNDGGKYYSLNGGAFTFHDGRLTDAYIKYLSMLDVQGSTFVRSNGMETQIKHAFGPPVKTYTTVFKRPLFRITAY